MGFDFSEYLDFGNSLNTGSGTVPVTDEGGGFADSLGDLLLGYATSRAALDVQNRADDINTPDRVDVATQAQAAATGQASPAIFSPWTIAAIVGVGIVGGILVYKAL